MGTPSDCELISGGFLGQPVNTLTTIAFIVAGGWIMRRSIARWVGIGLIATGLGSFVAHGPMPGWAEWAHDVTLAWLVLVIGGLQTRWERWSRLPGLVVLGLLFAMFPLVSEPVSIALVVVVLSSILIRRQTNRALAPLGLLAVVAVLGRLGDTGWPLCDPASVWQTHGLWHVGAAIAVAWWAATIEEPTRL